MDIRVYDGNGREVEVISNNMIFSGGTHQVTWNGDLHPSGIYFIKFTDGFETTIQKTILIK